jgi:hypothetical protein
MRRYRVYIALNFTLILVVLMAFAVSTTGAEELEPLDLSGRWMVGDGGFIFEIQMIRPSFGSITVDPEDADPFVDGRGRVLGQRINMTVQTFLPNPVEPIPILMIMWGRADATGETINGRFISLFAVIPIGFGTWYANRVP